MNIKVNIHPPLVDKRRQITCHILVGIYEIHKVGIISGSGIPSEFFHHPIKVLSALVIATNAFGGSLHAVAQGDDVYQDSLRRLCVVEILRITTLAIIPFMVTSGITKLLIKRRGYLQQFGTEQDAS